MLLHIIIEVTIISIMKLENIWHFARADLATDYLTALGTGLLVSTTIFAPRRTGKTVFLREDLTPAAEKRGYIVAYADLWQTKRNPGVSLIRGLEEALEPKTYAQKTMQSLRRPVKSIKGEAKLGDAGVGLEVDLEDPKAASTEMALRIEELVSQLVAKRPLLLLIDEAQELARTKEAELIATALRTAITKHRDSMRVVFTGSSRSQLAHVFSNTDAPLYSVGATVREFPLLDRGFVEFVAKKFEAATSGRQLSVEDLWAQFLRFNQRPEPLLTAVVAVLMNPQLPFEEAADAQWAEQHKEDHHEGTWAGLDPLQQQLALLFAEEPQVKPFAKQTLAKLAGRMGLKTLDTSSVQWAIRGLAERNVVARTPRGLFEFESDAFGRWVATRTE